MGKIRLEPDRIAALKVAQRGLHDILPDIDALEKCGVDCTVPRETYTMAHDQIEKILRLFGSAHEQREA